MKIRTCIFKCQKDSPVSAVKEMIDDWNEQEHDTDRLQNQTNDPIIHEENKLQIKLVIKSIREDENV